MNNIETTIRGLVCTRIDKRKFNNRYKHIINKYIEFLQKKNKGNNWVIGELMLMIGEKKNFEANYDNTKSAWSTYVVMCLYYSILDHHRRFGRNQIQVDKAYAKHGIRTYIERSDDIELEVDDSNNQEDSMYGKQIVPCIRNYIGPVYFDLRVAGFSQADISKKTGKSSDYLKKYFYRKRLGLLKHLEKSGYSSTDLPNTIINKLGGTQ